MNPTVSRLRFERSPSILTIDLEEWFCVCGDDYFSDPRRWDRFEARVVQVTEKLLDLLAGGGHRATFFVLGWVARRYPDLIRSVASKGHEIAFHGMQHRRCSEMSEEEFRADLRAGRDALEPLSGRRILGFRAPGWSIRSLRDPALRILAEEGFRYDSSVTPVPGIGLVGNDPYPSAVVFEGAGTLVEFPPLSGSAYFTTVLLGGSWGFRSVPFRVVLKSVDRFRSDAAPPIFAFHPWEFDRNHPAMTGLPMMLRLAHFGTWIDVGRRLDRLLGLGRTAALADLL